MKIQLHLFNMETFDNNLKSGAGITVFAHKILVEDFKTFKQRFQGLNRR